MSATTLLRQLESYAQEELGAQIRALELLEAQERALIDGDASRIESATRALERDLQSVPARARRRDDALAQLARLWELAPKTLTLASVAERAGDEGERLRRQRAELRDVLAKVARLTRRNTLRARVHERLNADVLQTVLAVDPGSTLGALIDAEG